MILPTEYRCVCGAVVYVRNAACPRCREPSPSVNVSRPNVHTTAHCGYFTCAPAPEWEAGAHVARTSRTLERP